LILELTAFIYSPGRHDARLLAYMKPENVKTGLLINFNEIKLKEEIKRFVL
jgi:GxxExxY protein